MEANPIREARIPYMSKKTPKKTSDLKDAGSLNIFKEMVKKWNIIYIE